ncbi:hypothetical protein B7494_g6156 [Chlorociboria aeruginascens]|nr:hypothetical protein B7494_g6156 [Chlorociboria aeruginascens]
MTDRQDQKHSAPDGKKHSNKGPRRGSGKGGSGKGGSGNDGSGNRGNGGYSQNPPHSQSSAAKSTIAGGKSSGGASGSGTYNDNGYGNVEYNSDGRRTPKQSDYPPRHVSSAPFSDVNLGPEVVVTYPGPMVTAENLEKNHRQIEKETGIKSNVPEKKHKYR